MKVNIKFLLIFLTFFKNVNLIIKVGVIFPEQGIYQHAESCFKFAVQNINNDKEILANNLIEYDIRYVQENNSYDVYRKVCDMVNDGVQVFFALSKGYFNLHVQSVCDTLDIPLIVTENFPKSSINAFVINLYPNQILLSQAFIDAIYCFKWTKIGILIEKSQGVLHLPSMSQIDNVEAYVRVSSPKNFIDVLKEFKIKEIFHVLVDVNPLRINRILKNLMLLQMNEHKYHYMFTNFDLESLITGDLKYNFVNISYFRLVDSNDVHVKTVNKKINAFQEIKHNFGFAKSIPDHILPKTELALIYDAVHIFAVGAQTFTKSNLLKSQNISCATEASWRDGLSLINYINSVEWRGLSGPIQFKEGQRLKFKLDLLNLKHHSVAKFGEWSPKHRLNISGQSSIFQMGTMNVTLVVMTILEPPYVMMYYGKNFTGNDRFYGFCVDLLKSIANVVGFDYILDIVPDRKYGAEDPTTGKWNGMVLELMKNRADLAVGPITITYARERVIDFTKPFMNLGISILFKVPTEARSPLFSFMNPLAIDVWLYVLAAYFAVSLTIYILSKISSNQLTMSNDCICNGINLYNEFSLLNSFWFTIGSLTQQNFDLSPKCISVRIVSSIWWFFTIIIIASYTANLAAFLTVERMVTPIENAEDLASQSDILYGTLDSGSTMAFFRDSIIETYRKMWRNMDNKRNISLTSSYQEGVRRVNNGNYAFLMESTMLDYIVQRDCNLTQIGGLLDTKGYGIALPKNSLWRDRLSLAILQLQEKGDIQLLYNKWWKKSVDVCIKKSFVKQHKANALGWDNIGGVFVVLIGGILIATCVSLAELFLFDKRQKSNEANSSRGDCILINRPSASGEFIVEEATYIFKRIHNNQRIRLRRQCKHCN